MCYYPFVVNFDRHNGSCNTPDDIFGKICVSNQTKIMNLSIFHIITRISELKTLTNNWATTIEYHTVLCLVDNEINLLSV